MVIGKQFREDQFIWLMQWAYCGIQRAREDTVRLNLVGEKSLEGLGASGRLGWRFYCYSCILTNFIVDHFTGWRATERFFAEFFSFLFDNMCRCYLAFASLYPLLFAFNYCYVVIKLWLRVF